MASIILIKTALLCALLIFHIIYLYILFKDVYAYKDLQKRSIVIDELLAEINPDSRDVFYGITARNLAIYKKVFNARASVVVKVEIVMTILTIYICIVL